MATFEEQNEAVYTIKLGSETSNSDEKPTEPTSGVTSTKTISYYFIKNLYNKSYTYFYFFLFFFGIKGV